MPNGISVVVKFGVSVAEAELEGCFPPIHVVHAWVGAVDLQPALPRHPRPGVGDVRDEARNPPVRPVRRSRHEGSRPFRRNPNRFVGRSTSCEMGSGVVDLDGDVELSPRGVGDGSRTQAGPSERQPRPGRPDAIPGAIEHEV